MCGMFTKNFYHETDRIRNMTDEEAEDIRRRMKIVVVKGSRDLRPLEFFEDAGFAKNIEKRLYAAGFKSPSAIQAQAWPILLSGYDMIGIADTGSGKTLAFLLPAVVHIQDQDSVAPGDGPIALILAPTRELVEQIRAEAVKFALNMNVGVAYGGASRRGQLREMSRGLDILVACPGRLIDFLERGEVRMKRVTYLVLDEADRMLDMGFEPQIRTVVRDIQKGRQTLMFSATWPLEVQTLARDLCKEDPVHVAIGSVSLKANHAVEQVVHVVSSTEKHKKFTQLMKYLTEKDSAQRILIFTETKRGCDEVTRSLRQAGYEALSIHGDKEQRERMYVLSEFRSGRHPIMVATDVASRGLDIKNVKVVVNYDMPNIIEDYVHRIGRTGRAGARGVAHTFITDEKAKIASQLVKVMDEANQIIPHDLVKLSSSNFTARGFPTRRYSQRSSYRFNPYTKQANNHRNSRITS